MTQSLVIEVAPFNLANGVPVPSLLAASDRMEREFLSKAEGYIGRMLVQKDTEVWADIVLWQSAAHAEKAMEQVASSEACGLYFNCMAAVDHNDPGHGVTLFEMVRRYGAASL